MRPTRVVLEALGLGLLVLLVACAAREPRLVPAGGTATTEGRGIGAVEEAAGVRVEARFDAWSGQPRFLDAVEPVRVTLENEGSGPVRLRYGDFRLVTPDGQARAALPPFDIEGTEVEPVTALARARAPRGFHVAPWHSPYFPHWHRFGGHFAFDRLYYDDWYPRWERFDLPTGDMIQKALPEGVLDPGGRVTGFLYFEPARGASRVVFEADLVRPGDDRAFATVEIPFTAPAR